MSDKKFNINSLRIASPCHVPWDSMAGDDRTRHCDLCSLNVYNVAALNTAEVEKLVGANKTRLCVRLYRRSDGTVLTKDCPVGLRAIQKRVARFVGATLAAVPGLFSFSFGQKDDNKPIDASKVKITRTVSVSEKSALSGTVYDQNGAVIPGAKIVLILAGHEVISRSDADGNYHIQGVSAGIYKLEVTSSGFKQHRLKNFIVNENESSQLDVVMKATGEVMGIYVSEDYDGLDTESSTIKTVFDSRKIDSIPH